jgi:fucose 4-O-acetylase-like acetyltransferase
MEKRIDYIDIIKGFSILWVVLFHCHNSLFYSQDIVMGYRGYAIIFFQGYVPLFFFLSGIFFRQRKFMEFFTKRFQTLIVPFIAFYVIGVLVSIIQYNVLAPNLNIDNIENIGTFKEYAFAFIYLFHMHPPVEPLIVNLALWFVPALFMIQMLHYVIIKLTNKKWLIIFFAIMFYGVSIILKKYGFVSLFLSATKYYIFYMFGSLYGQQLLKIVDNKVYACRLALFSLVTMFLLRLLIIPNEAIISLRYISIVFCFIAFVFVFFRYTKDFKIINWLKFWGQHSLEVLVTHVLIISLINEIIIKYFQKIFSLTLIDHLWIYIILSFLIIVLLEIPIIKFCNQYLPQFLGKKPFTIPRWSKKNVGLVKLDDESENKQEAG